jgi:CBS domain containing-hemolysin-like protein
MPDSDAPSHSDGPSRGERITSPSERLNLPVPLSQPPDGRQVNGVGWLRQILRVLFGWKAGSIRKDLEVVLETGASVETGFSPEERTMLKNILRLRGQRAEDVMVPRPDIVAVQQEISLGELIMVFERAGHSRVVVYNDTLDDPVGMVHIRDLVAYMVKQAAARPTTNTRRKKPLPANLDLKAVDLGRPLAATKITREVLFVPPSMPLLDLFSKMQATRIHLALVIDEYGGTEGLVSIEDIVEEIVGDIEDEHDEDEAPVVVRQPDGSFLVDARATLEELTAALGAEFDVGSAAEEVDTLGGYLFKAIGRVPVRGELVAGPGPFEIEVADADPRRIKKVRIYRKSERLERPTRTGAEASGRTAGNPPTSSLAPVKDEAAAARPPGPASEGKT